MLFFYFNAGAFSDIISERENMIKKFAFLIAGLFMLPNTGWAASCSRINLTKCLDSACAINLSSNPGARCQYCGTADAGTPADTGLKSISAGTSSKNTIPAKELKQAPSDPGDRYVWATKKCLEIVQNCSPDDVEEAYDPLIEKSCTAAGIKNDMASLQKKTAKNKKTATSCTDEISACITKAEKCNSDYSKCADDAQFNNFFASCSSQATGCTNFIDAARKNIISTRDSTLNARDSNIQTIVNARKNAREQKISSIKSKCAKNSDFDICVENVCQNNTNSNCATSDDKTIANALCQFHKTACTKVK